MNSVDSTQTKTVRLQQLLATATELLAYEYPGEEQIPRRENAAMEFIGHEAALILQVATQNLSLAQLALKLSEQQIRIVSNRSLFYCCAGVIQLLVNKRFARQPMIAEEAVLYIQDRLLRDDFRRIDNFDQNKGATFKTYIWQVISNLLIDFSRKHGKRRSTEYSFDDLDKDFTPQAELSAQIQEEDVNVEASHLATELVAVMDEVLLNENIAGTNRLRQKLRLTLDLESQERLFLKALFQHELSMNVVIELPGFSMPLNEAYRYYYQIMDKIIEAFKRADVLHQILQLLDTAAGQIALIIDGVKMLVPAEKILCLLKQAGNHCSCHFEGTEVISEGTTELSFNKLKNVLLAYCSPVSTSALIADKLLANIWKQHDGDQYPRQITIPAVD